MSLRELFLSSARSALALTCCLGLPNALAEEAAHGEHEGEHAHHYHHEVAPGFTRTLAAYAVPAVTLIDQSGQRVSLPELLATDRPVLLNFIYTSCTVICPVMSATFEKVQSGLGEEARRVLMVSISIDPEQDTPEALAAYAKRFHAGPQWSFLTGSLEDSIAAQKAFDAYRGAKMNHTPLTLLHANPKAQWVRYDGFANAADLVQETRGMLTH